MVNRRKLLGQLAALPFLGSLFHPYSAAAKNPISATVGRDYFKELGVRTFINAAGTYTSMAGAASAITLGTAGVLTGNDPKKASRIPNDLTGMKTEVILQKSHLIGYAHAIKNCGVKLILVETQKELEAAINEKTAMLWFLNAHNYQGKIQYKGFLEAAKKYNIPSFNDCAADVPPVENLWKYTDMGFDLVAFSGGKGMRGPQSTGLLLGRKDLIEAARLSAPPRGDTLGRGMKVNKEEILAMLIALENYLGRDHDKDWQLWDQQIRHIASTVGKVNGVKPEIHIPDIANHVPSLKIHWDESVVKTNPNEVRQALRDGHPSIETVGGAESVNITTWMLNPGEERIVAQRLKEILSKASS